MPIQFLNPKKLFNSKQYGFSQVAVAKVPGMLFNTSGQVALNANEEIVGEDVLTQTRQALRNIKLAIEEMKGSLSDIMMLRIYYVHKDNEPIDQIGVVLREFFGTENPPASTWLGVCSLARPEFLIEIEASGIIIQK
jgi:2-iminobutanoate/2-iminopropanoate deaminase